MIKFNLDYSHEALEFCFWLQRQVLPDVDKVVPLFRSVKLQFSDKFLGVYPENVHVELEMLNAMPDLKDAQTMTGPVTTNVCGACEGLACPPPEEVSQDPDDIFRAIRTHGLKKQGESNG